MEQLGWGAVAGLAAALPVGVLMATQHMVTAFPGWLAFAAYALVIGVALGAVARGTRQGLAMTASAGVLLGALGWLAFSLTLEPLLHGVLPTWSAVAAAKTYPELVGNVLHGAITGLLLHCVVGVWTMKERVRRAPSERTKVVVVGGGFAGVAAAQRFERLVLRGAKLDVTLVSDSNFLLFTPMLAEVASGALEPAHISAPIRSAAAHTTFLYGRVDRVDSVVREVVLESGEVLGYDHLVLAVGSVPHTFGLPGIAEHSFPLKNLADAVALRNHVLRLLEAADRETDPRTRRELLTFVVAGAGFAGTETIAELFDLVHGVSHYYPGIAPEEPRFVLVHAGDRILPELGPELAAYSMERLAARGIEHRLKLRVTEAAEDLVRLENDELIATRTFVWTAGNKPASLVGALTTDTALRAEGMDNVWAVGDCARIPMVDGGFHPPTAQHALRQGKAVADNIAAVVAGRTPVEFRFHTIGVLVALGHRTAAAEIRGRRFAGLVAWLLWRGIYLSKLPGVEKRLRVLFDWTLDLVFPRDIVVTSATPRKSKVRAR
ncbi:NAD(P)/FAD-dependent oxidoreductase [Kutzneria sp. NPDC051319]|uniref:NAD(P)/FAD-dependent oxidoreductase n=1 Tax=Kutzneria sp. NPDC051319 TaxID=3155047 RepID=UPI00343AEFDC